MCTLALNSVFIYSKVHMFCTHQQQRGASIQGKEGRKAGVSELLAALEQQT